MEKKNTTFLTDFTGINDEDIHELFTREDVSDADSARSIAFTLNTAFKTANNPVNSSARKIKKAAGKAQYNPPTGKFAEAQYGGGVKVDNPEYRYKCFSSKVSKFEICRKI